MFDCPVYVQAFLSDRGPAFACLELAEAGTITLCVSAAVMAEVAEVLTRPTLRRNRRTITPLRVREFLDRLALCAHVVEDVPDLFSFPRDPKDEPYVNLALSADAPYLVTWDSDLLDLMDHDRADGREFVERFPSLRIVTPPDLLRAMRLEDRT